MKSAPFAALDAIGQGVAGGALTAAARSSSSSWLPVVKQLPDSDFAFQPCPSPYPTVLSLKERHALAARVAQ